MKVKSKFLAIGLYGLFTISLANAQPEFESLRLNSAPSYVILGVEPENISRPVSPTELVGGFQNAIAEGKLKPNFAMEFTPYYFKNPSKDPRRFNALEYIAPERNIIKNIIKTFSVSIGTSASDSATFGKLTPGTALGIGVRFTLFEGKPNQGKLMEFLEWNEAMIKGRFLNDLSILLTQVQTLEELENLIDDESNNFKENTLSNSDFNDLSHTYSKQVINDLLPDLRKLLIQGNVGAFKDSIQAKMEKYNSDESSALSLLNTNTYPFAKQGFMLEAAAGEAILFENSEWGESAHAKAAIWITPSYRWDVSNENRESVSLLDAMGVLRYTFNNRKDSVDVSDYFDAGLKGKFTRKRWSFSVEGVYRYATDIDNDEMKKNYTYRLTTSFDFKINEFLTMKANFGTTFNGNTITYTEPKKLFAIAGLNINVFN